MSYNVHDKNGNASYIVRDKKTYPETFEPIIAEYAQLLRDINTGIALVPNISTGAEYFNYLSTGGEGGATIIQHTQETLTLTDSNISTYNNKIVVMDFSSYSAYIELNISSRSYVPDNFRTQVIVHNLYPNPYIGIDVSLGATINGTTSTLATDKQESPITIALLPGSGVDFMVSGRDIVPD